MVNDIIFYNGNCMEVLSSEFYQEIKNKKRLGSKKIKSKKVKIN